MELFDRNKRTIKSIYEDFNKGVLTVDASYQRRHVWLLQDKVRLIETILMGLIVPEVFFWPATVDPETGNMLTHIVDGQQRIDAIVDFIDGKYKLNAKFLLNKEIREAYSNKFFSELSSEAKTKIWTYKLSVVDIDKSWNTEQIKVMFYRLNLTNYSLNEQEKRNSKNSAFGDKSESLSTLDFWNKLKVFSATDARRMKDTEYCCGIYILAIEGVVDQTGSQKVNQYYDDYAEVFDEDGALQEKIIKAMNIIESCSNRKTISFISKKAQMYTMFCLAFRMLDDDIALDEKIKNKITLFISAYNLFRNEYDLTFEDPAMSSLYEAIKKYKLASSEGINKYQNRMIRYEQLYKTCVSSDDGIVDTMASMIAVLSDRQADSDADEYENDSDEDA